MHIYIHTYIHTYVHTYIHTCIHTYLHTYMHTWIRMYTPTYSGGNVRGVMSGSLWHGQCPVFWREPPGNPIRIRPYNYVEWRSETSSEIEWREKQRARQANK